MLLNRFSLESEKRLIPRDPVGSCSLPVRMRTGDPEAMQRLAERAGWAREAEPQASRTRF